MAAKRVLKRFVLVYLPLIFAVGGGNAFFSVMPGHIATLDVLVVLGLIAFLFVPCGIEFFNNNLLGRVVRAAATVLLTLPFIASALM